MDLEQEKVLAWAKALVARNGVEVSTIQDFTQGEVLVKLFEHLAKHRVPKVIIKPKLRIERVQNLNVALSFAKSVLDVKNFHFTGEDLVDKDSEQSIKAAWSLLTMLYKKYCTHDDHEVDLPLLEWARSIVGVEIPSLKSMKDGQAFLILVTKLAEHSMEYEETTIAEDVTIEVIKLDQHDPLEQSVQLAKNKLGLHPSISADQIAAGSSSAILSFLTLLHNVDSMRMTRTQYEEDNSKAHERIQQLRASNSRLVRENTRVGEDVEVMLHEVIAESLNSERAMLKQHVEELKSGVAAFASHNKALKEAKTHEENERYESSLLFKYKLEKHVFLLRDHLVSLPNSYSLVADIHASLDEVNRQMVGLSEEDQLKCIQEHIQSEVESIHALQEEVKKVEQRTAKKTHVGDEQSEEDSSEETSTEESQEESPPPTPTRALAPQM